MDRSARRLLTAHRDNLDPSCREVSREAPTSIDVTFGTASILEDAGNRTVFFIERCMTSNRLAPINPSFYLHPFDSMLLLCSRCATAGRYRIQGVPECFISFPLSLDWLTKKRSRQKSPEQGNDYRPRCCFDGDTETTGTAFQPRRVESPGISQPVRLRALDHAKREKQADASWRN